VGDRSVLAAGIVGVALGESIGQTCRLRKNGKREVCAEFYFGSRNGDLVWNKIEEAWTLPSMKRRSMRSIEIKIRAGYDSSGYPYLLERCPFCGGLMPPPVAEKQPLQLPPGDPDE